MKTLLWNPSLPLLAALLATPKAPAADEAAPAAPAGVETLESADGGKVGGRLEGDPAGGFRFVAKGSGAVTPLGPGMTVRFPGQEPNVAAGLPPFRVELGLGQRLSGRLVGLDAREVKLGDVAGDGKVTAARAGVDAVVQRPGESLVLQDGFDALDTARWAVVGEPEVVEEPRLAGTGSLRVAAGGASLTHRLAEPFGSGRLEVAFHDPGTVARGQQWFVDLTFRAADGRETIRVVLGWSEESLSVESPGGPALAVQRLARRPGWHRLAVRFGPEVCEIAVDGNELAHGKGFGGQLVEARLASFGALKEGDRAPAGFLDDLRLVRFAEPVGGLETDVSQDEVRLTSGDQLFGEVRRADAERVSLAIDGKDVSLSWGEVSGVYLRRTASPGAPVEGLLVRAEWRAAPGTDPRDLNVIEGALVNLGPKELTVATPYAGSLAVPRSRLTALAVLGRGLRLVIDPKAHHLGDEVSTTSPMLDPPQPEGGVLERAFELPKVPSGAAFLVLDVVQVVGEAPDLQYSALVKKGELRTNLKFNGEPFDYLNRYITTRNETPERVRIPIPRGLFRPGRNVIRFEQAGIAGDPNYLDDLGLIGVAVEFAPGPGGEGAR
jgi:hypothetical protein